MKKNWMCSIACFILLLLTQSLTAQNLLGKTISLDVNRQRLDQVLEIVSNKGNFYFSYNSGIVKRDSLVSFAIREKTVREVLGLLFNSSYEFKESGNYIIIRKAPIRMVLVTQQAVEEERIYSVSGFVYDEQTGRAIHEASVYEKKQLVSALTGRNGFFKLKLKSSKASYTELTVSKELYEDTTVTIEPRKSQQVTITLNPLDNRELDIIVSPLDVEQSQSLPEASGLDTNKPVLSNVPALKVERTGWGRFMLSARQRVQTVNLKKFFTTRPFQVSLVPGLGSHGQMSGQVINNFSLNVLGGYTAGTRGAEIGGIFNINKKGAAWFQAAGVFNAVGGPVRGFQVAGVNNLVLDTVKAFQAAGVNNVVKGNFSGMQVAGVYNHVTDTVRGFQASGVGNFARKQVRGVQVAGVLNFSHEKTSGVQISGVFNYTRRLKGVQFGLINIADTSDGFSIGLINIVLKGYHKLSISTSEMLRLHAAFKTGNHKFYSILQAGMQTGLENKLYAFGYGLGSEIGLNKKQSLTFNPEISSSYLYAGTWDYLNLHNRLALHLNIKAGKYFSVFAGPAFNVLVSDQRSGVAGYRYPIQPAGYKTIHFSNRVSGWFGWNIGVHIF